MINIRFVKKCCNEDISLIENYREAINSDIGYVLHHKLEIKENKSTQKLKEEGKYYNRPASELIFLTKSEHSILHFKNRSEETLKKISIGNKGKIVSEETRKKISEAKKGKKLTEEHKRKLSEAHKGYHHTEEWKRNISEKMKGNKHGVGYHHTEEHKAKLSKKMKGKPQPWNSRPLTEEHKAKLREGLKKYWENKRNEK